MTQLSKLIIVALDGSEEALKALDYLGLIYGAKQNVEVQLLYVLPSLPQILIADQNRETKVRLLNIDKKNVQMAAQILADAKGILLKKGFKEDHIKTVHRKKQIGVAGIYATLRRTKEQTVCSSPPKEEAGWRPFLPEKWRTRFWSKAPGAESVH